MAAVASVISPGAVSKGTGVALFRTACLDGHDHRDYLRVEVETMGECHAFGLRLHCDSHPRCKLRLATGKPNRGRRAAGTDRT